MTTSVALVAGRYRLVRLIGEGGMGRVWLARDELLDRDVAAKELSVRDRSSDGWPRAVREAQAAARLAHPNVVRVYDVLHAGGRPWIVMEYVPARSLESVIEDGGPLPPARAAAVCLPVLDALVAAHRAGVLHRDIKPHNVLVADDGRILLGDFGVAAFNDAGEVTHERILLGSPLFVAPERLQNGASTVHTDLWSFGALLYHTVEGRPPYSRPTLSEQLAAICTDGPDPLRLAGPLAPVIEGLLVRDPAQRLTATIVRHILRGAIGRDGRLTTPSDDSPTEILVGDPPPRRRAPTPAPTDDSPTQVVSDDSRTEVLAVHPEDSPTELIADRTPSYDDSPTEVVADPDDFPTGVIADPDEPLPTPDDAAADRTTADDSSTGVIRSDDPPPVLADRTITDDSPTEVIADHGAAGRRPPVDLVEDATQVVVPVTIPAQVRRQVAPRWLVTHKRPMVGALAAAVALAAGTTALVTYQGHPSAAAPVAAAAPSASAVPARLPCDAATFTGPSTVDRVGPSTTPAALAGGTGPSPLPVGLTWQLDPAGFRIGVPTAWTRDTAGTEVCFRAPDGRRRLTVQTGAPLDPDRVGAWQKAEQTLLATTAPKDYHRVDIGPAIYRKGGADWEYTYVDGGVTWHALRRSFALDAARAYIVTWTTPDADWALTTPQFLAVATSFDAPA